MIDLFPYICWIPLVAWLGLFFVSRYLSFPLDLKKRLKRGENWVYIPAWWKARGLKVVFARFFRIFVMLLASIASALDVYFILKILEVEPAAYGLFSGILFFVVAIAISKWAAGYAFQLEQRAYYLFMQRLRVSSQKKGLATTMDNLRSRSNWELQRILSRVEKRGDLFKYLKAAANTKKFPKELYTEVVR